MAPRRKVPSKWDGIEWIIVAALLRIVLKVQRWVFEHTVALQKVLLNYTSALYAYVVFRVSEYC